MRRTPINPLAKCLIAAIPMWRNLAAVTIIPTHAPEGLFTEPLRLLRGLPDLRTLKVNSACADALSAAALSRVVGLKSLTLVDPNRAILDLLPDWLSRLSNTLHQLHLLVSTIPSAEYTRSDPAGRKIVVPSLLGSYGPSSPWQYSCSHSH